jgi:thiamine-monophosphate kinase
MACGEFSLIARYFDRVKSARLDVETGIGDDCALLNIPEKKTLAISTDTLVAGNHFYPISTLPTSPIKRWRST